ncbi:MAG: hypothetical protein IKT55_07165 [Clostridia bacterium]|nr:hypothetical protein [Clostridia bacterium]
MQNTVKLQTKNYSQTNNGVFEGWGTSLCWWAHRIGYSPELTKKSGELFFSKKGLNLNIMRYNIGGGDDPTHKHIKRTDSIIPGWLNFNNETKEYYYDYTADTNQLNVLKEAYKNAGENALVEVFSNSSPYFMTKSGCTSGNKNPNYNNLKEECYTDFAEYIAHVTEYINNKLNINVYCVSPMNEPNTDYWEYFSEKQEGCHYDPGESQNKMLIETAKAIKNKGLRKVKIVGSDETSTEKQLEEYHLYTYEVKKILDRVNVHTYIDDKTKELGELMQKENKNIWMSETDWSNVSGENAGEMGAALWFGEKIISDINALSPSAWVIWLVIDCHRSKQGFMGNKDSGFPSTNNGYWGVAFADHDEKEIYLSKKYYAFGQFSRYVRPGDTIIHIDSHTLGAIDKKTGRVTVVAINSQKADVTKTFDLNDLNKVTGNVEVIRTSGNLKDGENWAKLPSFKYVNATFNYTIKGNSITTFIIK